MSEEGLAKLLNIVMVSALVGAVLAFLAWGVVSDVPNVMSIYQGLTPQQQGQLSHFADGVIWLVFGLAAAAKWVVWSRRRAVAGRTVTPS